MVLFLVLFFLLFFQETQIELANDVANSRFYTSSYRFYDSKVGRFLSADPVVPEIQSNKGLSRYAYVYNNPIQFDDPDGHRPNDRSRDVRSYDEALADYNNQLLVGLGYAGSFQEDAGDRENGREARFAQAAAFGAREALRFNFAYVEDGKAAKIVLGLGVPQYEDEFRDFSRLVGLASSKVDGPESISSLAVSGLNKHTLDTLSDVSVTSNFNLYVMRTEEAAKAGAEGVRLGLSQTPILGRETLLSRAVEFGNNIGFKVPMVLNVFGGGAGMLSAAQYENDFAQFLGMTGGGLELVAGVVMAIESKVLRAGSAVNSLAARHASAFRLLRARSASVLGGGMGLVAWGVFELNEYVPQKPLTPDWENMSPEERIETENKFIDPGF